MPSATAAAGTMVDVSSHPLSALRPRYPISTERLSLRPLTARDADALLVYRSQPDVCRYLPFEPMTRWDIDERMATQWACIALTDEGQALTLGVELAGPPDRHGGPAHPPVPGGAVGPGTLIGDVVLFWHSRRNAAGELGYVFRPDVGGRGYATEAAHAMLRLGFEELGLHRIVARIDERNEPSARLARRLGMRQEARLVRNELFKGEWSTELDFAMLAEEWFAGARRLDPARHATGTASTEGLR